MPTIHELKCWPREYEAIVDGQKTHDIRSTRNTRGTKERHFQVDDLLNLSEWSPVSESFSGRRILVRVTYVSTAPAWNLPPGLCVMSIAIYKLPLSDDEGV